MTNFEKWKDEILRIIDYDDSFGLIDGKPVECSFMNCPKCEFEPRCTGGRFHWLYEEYKEPAPKLTKREWHFVNYCETGYIARDEGGVLFWFSSVPEKQDSIWFKTPSKMTKMNRELFPFIKWEDEEPWKVEDLLKLEVEE